tara:strand:- start:6368 stop:6769 length:402 start_codon:yes stop_codon:yes gene_type:complete
MDQIINAQTQKQIQEGNRKIEENEFFQDLTTLMENPTFVRFFEKHLSNWIEVKSSITYMKLYKEFKDKYKKLTNEELDKSIIVFLLCQIMRDKQLRPFSIKTVDEVYDNKKKSFFKEFKKFLITQNKALLLDA